MRGFEEESDCWKNTSSVGRCNPTVAQSSLCVLQSSKESMWVVTVFVNDEGLMFALLRE